jgi:hypothetical protein
MHRAPALLALLVAVPLLGLPAPAATANGPAAEDPPLIGIGHRHTIPAPTLGEPVNLIVHLPARYAEEDRRYPVLLLLGSDLRSKFAQAAATLDVMTDAAQLPACILVGIDLPKGNFVLVPREGAGETAGADRYLAAIGDEILPDIDRTFRTNGYRILYGPSNSGLFAVYALVTGRLPVQAYLASSPMLGWCPRLLGNLATAAWADPLRPSRFLFLVWSDDDSERVAAELPAFVARLERSAPAWLHWKTEVRHHEGHVPEMDLALGLRALFPDFSAPLASRTLAALQSHYAALGERYGFTVEVPEARLFDTGLSLAHSGELGEAQRLLAYGAEQYPRNARMRTGLGFVCSRRGDPSAAAAHLQQALALDPSDSWARQLLAEIHPPR